MRNITYHLTNDIYDPSASSMWYITFNDKAQTAVVSFTSEVHAFAFSMQWAS